jgi:hypothetical protein
MNSLAMYQLNDKIRRGNIMNMKLRLGMQICAEDFFSTLNKLTKFGRDNLEGVMEVANIIIDEAYKSGHMEQLLNKISLQIEQENYKPPLWSSTIHTFALEQAFSDMLWEKKWINFGRTPLINHFVSELARASENMYRESQGLPRVNEGWVNEVALYYAIKNTFANCNVIHQYRPKWLGLQSLDIYIQEINVAIEYQGAQHLRPIEFFGGEEAFKKQQERDKKKRQLCDNNKVILIYAYEGYVLKNLIDEIHLNIPSESLHSPICSNDSTVLQGANLQKDIPINTPKTSGLFSDILEYTGNPNESIFMDAFFEKLEKNNLDPAKIKVWRMGKKQSELHVGYDISHPSSPRDFLAFGFINLSSEKTGMRINDASNLTWYESESVDKYISLQQQWIDSVITSIKNLPLHRQKDIFQ